MKNAPSKPVSGPGPLKQSLRGELRHYYLGRQAIVDQDWDTAIRELKRLQGFISGSVSHLRQAERQSEDALNQFQKANGPREQLPLFQRSLTAIKKQAAEAEEVAAETDCARFVVLCREVGLLTTASVAIDGSKFKAVNNRDRNFTKAKVSDLCRKHGISDATFYKWRSRYGGMEISDARKLKGLEEENRKLK